MISLKPLLSVAQSLTSRVGERMMLFAQDLGADGANPAPAQDIDPLQRILGSPFVLGGGLLALFYIMVLLPEKRKKKQAAAKLSQLKKNQRVITIGGIHGVVVSAPADSDVITIKTDDSSNSRMRVNRSAIATVLSDDKDNGKKDEES